MAYTYETAVEAAKEHQHIIEKCIYVYVLHYDDGGESEVLVSTQQGVEHAQRTSYIKEVEVLHQENPNGYSLPEAEIRRAVKELYKMGALESGIINMVRGVIHDARKERV